MAEAENILLPATHNLVSPSASSNLYTMVQPSQLFEIPELLGLVSSFLTQGDACAFIKCSHACFHAAVGQVWEFVPGVCRLFALLPGVTLASNGDKEATIILPDLTECDFGRFDFYASYVKRLKLFSSYYPETVDNWNNLISYAQHKRLLPNLQHIIYFSGSTEQMSWLSVLLSSTLLSIRCQFANRSNVGIDHASDLLQNIQTICPGLEELSLHPVFYEGLVSPNGPVLPTSRIYESFSLLQNLRVFSTTMNFYDRPALLALARLPRLETLEISGMCYSLAPPPAITLPDGSFPSLRNFLMRELHIKYVQCIWNIPQLVSKLSLVSVSVVRLRHAADENLVFSSICDNSPRIVNFNIELAGNEKLSPASFWWLKKLSLEKLSVDAISLSHVETSCHVLAKACPLLRELRMPRADTSIFELRHFAQLSRLEYLQVCIDWSSLGDLPEVIPEPSCVSHAFRQLEGDRAVYHLASPAQVQRHILYLLSFWPELESIEAWIATIEDPKNPSSTVINQTLQTEQDAKRSRGDSYRAGVPEAHFNDSPIGLPTDNP